MSYTIQQSINWAQSFIEGMPLSAFTGNEPALSSANSIQNTICNAPFTWGWNRAENSAYATSPTVQDYLLNITDFAYLEKMTLVPPIGAPTPLAYEIKDIYNTNALGFANSTQTQRPMSVAVKSIIYGTSVSIRFMGVPDLAYQIVLTYQKLIQPLTALTGAGGNWLMPDSFLDVYNNLFLAEALQAADDARAQLYRQRGIAMLLAKADGLSEMDKNNFLGQYFAFDAQGMRAQLRTNQSVQARGV